MLRSALVMAMLVTTASGCGASASDPARESTPASRAASPYGQCILACQASHCGDDVGGGCYHVCNIGRLFRRRRPLDRALIQNARFFESHPCAYVSVTSDPADPDFIHLGHLESEGERFRVDERMEQSANALGGNVIAELACTQLSEPRESALAGDTTVVRCSGEVYRDPSRSTRREESQRH